MTLILQTTRLRLRSLERDDLPWLARLHGDPRVMQYVRPPEDTAATARRLEELLAEAAREPRLGVWPAERLDDGTVIGWFVLTRLDGGDELELGYRLFPEHWGKGYATEGTLGVARYVREVLGADRVCAVVREGNAASMRVLEKAGFAREDDREVYGLTLAYFTRSLLDRPERARD